MKRSIKAALLSGLVFPGVGHIYLKRYATGIALVAISCIATYYLIANAVQIAFAITDRLTAGDMPLDTDSIDNLVTTQSQQVATSSSIATYVVFAAWLIGIVDSYRIGVAQERNQNNVTRP